MIDNKMPALSLVPTENQTELKQTTTDKTYLERMISFEKERCCCCLLMMMMMQMWRSVVACTPDSGSKRLTQILCDDDANVAICLLHALLIPAAKD
jgi:hypothetical protein